MTDSADCFWLIDAIASHQPEVCRNPRLADFQLWTLTVTSGDKFKSAVLTCTDGDDDMPVIRQAIGYTDFPLPSIRLYVESRVLLLPSEH